MRQRNFDRIVIALISEKKICCQNFFETQGSPYDFFRYWDKKRSPENRDTHPHLIQFFSVPEIFWNTKSSPRIFSALWDKKTTVSWYPHFPRTFLIPERFWNSRVLLRHSPALWEAKFSTEIGDIPQFAQKFSIPQVSRQIERFPTKFFRTVKQRSFEKKTW